LTESKGANFSFSAKVLRINLNKNKNISVTKQSIMAYLKREEEKQAFKRPEDYGKFP